MSKNSLVSAFDDLPWIVKLILAFPIIGSVWGLYRVIKGVATNNIVMLIAGIIWIFVGWAILWIVDIICIVLYKKPVVFA